MREEDIFPSMATRSLMRYCENGSGAARKEMRQRIDAAENSIAVGGCTEKSYAQIRGVTLAEMRGSIERKIAK